MEGDVLRALFNEAHIKKKYIWLKHLNDPNPLYGIFSYRDSPYSGEKTNEMYVSLYYSCIDGYEGCLLIEPKDVEWAHISQQSYFTEMERVLAEAALSQKLLRIRLSDQRSVYFFFIRHNSTKEWIFSDGPFSHSDEHCVLSLEGYLVDLKSRTRTPEVAKISSKVIFEIENTDISKDGIVSCRDIWSKLSNVRDFCE